MGEAKRRRAQLAHEGTIGLRPDPRRPRLSGQQRTAALLMYLFAVLTWDPGPDDDEDDERWATHCIKKYASFRDVGLEACVWWAMRHEASRTDASGDDWIGYLEYVCANHSVLARE